MKSKARTSPISYNTDEITKQRAGLAATSKGISAAQLVRNAIHEFVDRVEPRKERTEGFTVILNQSDTELVRNAAKKTGLTQSSVIHECLAMYVMVHKEEIKRDMQLQVENMQLQVEQANKVLAA